jgi:pilus assembly protein CpaE
LASLASEAFPASPVETLKGGAIADLAGAARRADLVLLETDGLALDAVAGAIQRLAQASPQPAVILTGAISPIALVRALLKLQKSDVLESPLAPGELARVAAALLRSAEPAASMCWGIMGAVGGSGATTVAVEIGAALAARGGGRGCLIDLNLADGAACAYLGVQPSMRLEEAAASPERIDAALLDAFATPVCEGLDLLASARAPDAFEIATPQAVMRILEAAALKYDWLILDIPRHRRAWTLDVLSGCDEVLIISELTVPALIAARNLSQELEGELHEHGAPHIVLNRMSSRLLGPAPTLREAQKALKREALATLTSDWESAAKSVILGGPILHRQPRSKIVKDIAELIDRLQAGKAAGREALRIAG